MFRLPAEAEGLEILLKIVDHAPGSALGEKSMMRVADYHFAHQHWTEAVLAYDQYVKLFRSAAGVPKATLQAARASFLNYRGPQFDETPLLDAEQRFKIFREHYPREAEQAHVRQTLEDIRDMRACKLFTVAEFYRRVGQPRGEAYYYAQVIDRFPQTPWAQRSQEWLARLGNLAPRRRRRRNRRRSHSRRRRRKSPRSRRPRRRPPLRPPAARRRQPRGRRRCESRIWRPRRRKARRARRANRRPRRSRRRI